MDSKTMIRQLTLALLLGVLSLTGWSMTSLDDSALSNVTGQALIQMSQITGTGTSGTTGTGSSGLTFYRLGFDGSIDLNANINQLRLGCGGINGAGGCDISIDQMSISGNGCANRALNCDAVMTNPYIELAIANNSTPTTRSLAGFRVSAQNMSGLLSFGQNGATANGINTFSGYMATTPISGTATTAATNLSGATDTTNNGSGQPLQFNVKVVTPTIFGNLTLGTALATSIPSQSEGIAIPSMQVPYSVLDSSGNPAGATVNGNRQTSTSVTAYASIPPVNLSNWGPGGAAYNLKTNLTNISGILPSTSYNQTSGSVSGLTTKITFNEGLGYIHNVQVNSPFYLSFQNQAIQWPGAAAADVAQRGWWMSFADPVNVGTLNPVNQIDITPTFPQMAAAFVNYYSPSNPLLISLSLGQAIGALFSQPIPVPVTATISAQLALTVTNMMLDSHQNVVPNCMGNYKFC